MTTEKEIKIIEDSVRIIRERTDFEPEIGMILGSGLGDYADKIENPVKISYHDIPDFPVSTVAGHAGQFVLGTCMGKKVIAMQGRVHYYEGYSQRLITLPIRIMKRLGVKKVLLTNAAGGVNRSYEPGTLMVIKDHINYSGSNPLIGPNFEEDGPLQTDRLRTAADKPGAAGKHRHVFIDCIEKHQFHTCHRILQIQLQCLRLPILLHINSRQARQFRLSPLDGVAFVYKTADPASIFPSDSISRIPHIPGSKGRVFLSDMLQ